MKRIIAVGFKPYLELHTNPSEIVVRTIALSPGFAQEDFSLDPFILPVREDEKEEGKLLDAIHKTRPDLVLVFGAAPALGVIHLEEFFFNRFVGLNQHTNEFTPIHGEFTPHHILQSSIDNATIASCLRQRGIPAQVSLFHGLFFCNRIAYRIARFLAMKPWQTRYGLIHLPLTSEEVCENTRLNERPSLPRRMLIDAAYLICELS